jgi:hypothetical protein
MALLHPFVGTAEAFRDILNLVATRPVSAPFIWLAQVIDDWSPVRSQLLNAAMFLVTAVSVGILAAAMASSKAFAPTPSLIVLPAQNSGHGIHLRAHSAKSARLGNMAASNPGPADRCLWATLLRGSWSTLLKFVRRFFWTLP